MGFEDLGEQTKVAPRALGLDKKSSHDLASGVINGADQTQARSPTFQPIVR